MRKIPLLFFFFLMAMGSQTYLIKSWYPCEYDDFWWSVMMAESGGKPNTCFTEKDGTKSCGLYQLSLRDAKAYGCSFKKLEDLFDPVQNTDCKDKITAKLRLDGKTWDNSLARYWGTMRSRQNHTWDKWYESNPDANGYEHLQKFAKQRGCVIKD